MKQSKNQVKAKGNIYTRKDRPSGDPAHQTDDNSAKGTLLVRGLQESWGSSVTKTLHTERPLSEAHVKDLETTMQ